MKLKIVYNATSIEHPLTGVGVYALNMLKRLLLHSQVEQVRCVKGASKVCPYKLIEKHESSAPTVLPGRIDYWYKSWLKKIPHARFLVNVYRQRGYLEELKAVKDAVFFEPNYIVQQRTLPFVSVIHDLSHLHLPEFHPKERVSWSDDARNTPQGNFA